jgi:hypothetical protein
MSAVACIWDHVTVLEATILHTAEELNTSMINDLESMRVEAHLRSLVARQHTFDTLLRDTRQYCTENGYTAEHNAVPHPTAHSIMTMLVRSLTWVAQLYKTHKTKRKSSYTLYGHRY